jgi:DNA-binding XRE family transcriptional regulator
MAALLTHVLWFWLMVSARSRHRFAVVGCIRAAHPERMADQETIAANKALGSRIHWMRKARGLTQEELAQKARLAADTVRRAEAGEFAPSYTTMRKIAAGLAVPTHALLFDGYD